MNGALLTAFLPQRANSWPFSAARQIHLPLIANDIAARRATVIIIEGHQRAEGTTPLRVRRVSIAL